MNKSGDQFLNRYLIFFCTLIVLSIISFSCVCQSDNSNTGEGEDRCISSLIRRLGSLMYLLEWFPSWPNMHFFPSFVGYIWPAASFGLAVAVFTWIVIKMDSTVPGIYPPSPLSPRKIRSASGHDFHLCYVLAIVNGVTLGILSMGIDSG